MWQPSWFSSGFAPSAYFVKGGGVGGFDKLMYDGSFATYGNMTVWQMKPGQIETELIPSFEPLAFTGVEVKEDSVVLSIRGIGGAPEVIQLWTAFGKRYVKTPLKGGGANFDIEYPLHRKVIIGLDDTDSAAKGATWRTAMQIAVMVGRALKGVDYLRMVISLNWPGNPYKTTNNASTACVFSVKPGKEEELVSWFAKLARKYSISKDTGMAVINRVRTPEPLLAYSRRVKSVLVDVSEAYKVAEEVGARLIPITGGDKSRGLIGALSVVGLVDHPEEAMTPVSKE